METFQSMPGSDERDGQGLVGVICRAFIFGYKVCLFGSTAAVVA